MSNSKLVTINGELFWAKWMNTFNTKFNEANNKYECTIGNINDQDAAKLTDLGIKIKNKPEMGNFIVGKSMYLFAPTLTDGSPVKIEDIGNGTKIQASVGSYTHRMSAAHGNAPSIAKITVKEVVKYNAEEPVLDDVL
jgi:hypothetical protein